MQGGRKEGQIVAVALVAAMVMAPLIAFLVRPEAGLAVMTVALVATAVLLREARAVLPPRQHRWVYAAFALNLGLAAACVAALAWLLLRR